MTPRMTTWWVCRVCGAMFLQAVGPGGQKFCGKHRHYASLTLRGLWEALAEQERQTTWEPVTRQSLPGVPGNYEFTDGTVSHTESWQLYASGIWVHGEEYEPPENRTPLDWWDYTHVRSLVLPKLNTKEKDHGSSNDILLPSLPGPVPSSEG